METGDAFWRIEPLVGKPEEDETTALHIASWLWLRICFRPLSAHAFGMTGKIAQGIRVSARRKLCTAPLTLPMGFSWSMFFCQHVGLQQTNCADHPLSLPVVTDGGAAIVVGPNHIVGFRWNYVDNLGAVSTGATLTDRCFQGLCDSFRRTRPPVHEVTPAALSAETLGMSIISSSGGCGHTDKRIFRLRSALHVLMHRRRIVQLIACHLSFGSVASRGSLSILVAKRWMSCGIPGLFEGELEHTLVCFLS